MTRSSVRYRDPVTQDLLCLLRAEGPRFTPQQPGDFRPVLRQHPRAVDASLGADGEHGVVLRQERLSRLIERIRKTADDDAAAGLGLGVERAVVDEHRPERHQLGPRALEGQRERQRDDAVVVDTDPRVQAVDPGRIDIGAAERQRRIRVVNVWRGVRGAAFLVRGWNRGCRAHDLDRLGDVEQVEQRDMCPHAPIISRVRDVFSSPADGP